MKTFKVLISLIVIFMLSYAITCNIGLYEYVFNPNSSIIINHKYVYLIAIIIVAMSYIYITYRLYIHLDSYLHRHMSFDRFKKEIDKLFFLYTLNSEAYIRGINPRFNYNNSDYWRIIDILQNKYGISSMISKSVLDPYNMSTYESIVQSFYINKTK